MHRFPHTTTNISLSSYHKIHTFLPHTKISHFRLTHQNITIPHTPKRSHCLPIHNNITISSHTPTYHTFLPPHKISHFPHTHQNIPLSSQGKIHTFVTHTKIYHFRLTLTKYHTFLQHTAISHFPTTAQKYLTFLTP